METYTPFLTQAGDPPPASSSFSSSSSQVMPSSKNGSYSLFAAFRLAQLVNSFRRRIKTRVLSHGGSGKDKTKKVKALVQNELCHAFEKQAYEEIDRYLGRTSRHHRGKGQAKPKNARLQCNTPSGPRYGVADARVNAESITGALGRLDAQLPFRGHSVSEMAADSRLMLDRGIRVDLRQHCSRDLIADLSLIEYLLASTRSAYQQYHGFQDKDTAHPDWFEDELYLANLEYLLLCLRGQVLFALFIGHTSADIVRHITECQRQKGRSCKQWFFEFPDARHPLSTTWPWSIRPSLAVLWGVCWMFNVDGPRDSETGIFCWDDHDNLVNFYTKEVVWTEEDSRIFLMANGINASAYPNNAALPTPYVDYSQTQRNDSAQELSLGLHDEIAASASAESFIVPGFAGFGQPEPDPRRQIHHNNWGTAYACPYYSPLFQADNLLPEIRLTPTDTYPSSVNNLPVFGPDFPNFLDPSNSPNTEVMDSRESSRGRRFSVEPRSESQSRRARSLSSTTNALLESAQSPVRDRDRSPAASIPETLEELLPQRDKPRGKPTTTKDGKFVCEVCGIKPFNRRCEWNKHMDKHDRPYVCKKPECSSLQGFTYSGGLLRHQREVHGLHGGAKLKLYCHVNGCKRKTQNPFTRRENLAEHLRRVHKLNTPDPASPTSPASQVTNNAPSPDVDDQDSKDYISKEDAPESGMPPETQTDSQAETQTENHVNLSPEQQPVSQVSVIFQPIQFQRADSTTSKASKTSKASSKRKRDETTSEHTESLHISPKKHKGQDSSTSTNANQSDVSVSLKGQIDQLKHENEQLRKSQAEADRARQAQEKAMCETKMEMEKMRRQLNELVSVRERANPGSSATAAAAAAASTSPPSSASSPSPIISTTTTSIRTTTTSTSTTTAHSRKEEKKQKALT